MFRLRKKARPRTTAYPGQGIFTMSCFSVLPKLCPFFFRKWWHENIAGNKSIEIVSTLTLITCPSFGDLLSLTAAKPQASFAGSIQSLHCSGHHPLSPWI